MKPNLQLQKENNAQPEFSADQEKPILVPVNCQKLPGEKKTIWDRIAAVVERLFIALDSSATRAREMDEQLRRQRSEHYAKHGFYFRDRL